jgi:hypothetical protein
MIRIEFFSLTGTKANGYFDDFIWYMRHANGCDGYDYNQFPGCKPECRYYPEEGRIEDEEWKAGMKTKKRAINSSDYC